MSETKFTPGPWSLRGADTRWVTSPSATSMPWHVAEVIGGCDHDGSGLDRQNANAHLIAAAPDLYAFVAKVCERLEQGLPMHGDGMGDEAFAALAKARGELP